MVDVKVSGTVGAPPAAVFGFLADLENWPRWQSDMQSTTLIEGQPGQVERATAYVSKAMGQTFNSTVTVVRVDLLRELRSRANGPGRSARAVATPSSPRLAGVAVTLIRTPRPADIGRLMAPLIALMIRRLNRQHLETLRRLLEDGGVESHQ